MLNLKSVEDVIVAFDDEEYNHPIAVRVNPIKGGQQVTITEKGVVEEPSSKYSGGGVNIEIMFASEFGKFWKMKMCFHKGQTYLNVEELQIAEDLKQFIGLPTI
jgi:hypothetical protein